MNLIGLYASLSLGEQFLHSVHLMLCCFAVLIACIPAFTTKGSNEHKLAGKIYIPVSLFGLICGTCIAWNEGSFVLFSFNAFCAYLLLSGWRAVHEEESPRVIDWIIPGFLVMVASTAVVRAATGIDLLRSFYLLFFAANAFYLAYRDWKHLTRRREIFRNRIFFATSTVGYQRALSWLNRHVAGMVGSVLANLSVVVLTVLPFQLHFLWPLTLVAAGIYINLREREKRARVKQAVAQLLKPNFGLNGRTSAPQERPYRKAA